jgi:hypothetical protein
MDVLELPRPVINFLRTMAKEGCRYVLSWDIFGGTDTVTLTLTWKLNEDESQLSLSKSPQHPPVYDELHIRNIDSATSSPRRSRRDENTSTSAIFRSPRGKSLEGSKQIACPQQKVSSSERSFIINRQKKESDPIYTNLCHVKYATNPSPSFPLNNNPPLSVAHTNYRRAKQQCETPILRKVIPSTPPSKSRRINHTATQNNYDDDVPDPWVKRFECSLEDNSNETIEHSDNNTDETGITSGKVKFKRKPEYF